ncbi:MAG TPA: hypothetical protein VJV79_25840 [Polyangiaceae bacterium]|nr:hypothetical protein [Polyangiaceae bacterium]
MLANARSKSLRAVPLIGARARIEPLSAALLAFTLLVGCAHSEQIGAVSDSAVVVAGTAGGAILERPVPSAGERLVAAMAPGTGCIPDDRLLALLGPTCSHESENRAEVRPSTGELRPGKPTPTGRVSWYCEGRLVVRVVWDPCDGNQDGKMDGFSPVEISVATHPVEG